MGITNKEIKKYYKTKLEVLSDRKKGDRIYYDSKKRVYYIVRPQKRSFWGFK